MDNNVLLTHDNIPNEISKIMVELNHPDPEGWKQLLPPIAFNASTPQEQRFHTNRVWRQILTDLPLDQLDQTREARICLVDTFCETVDYLRFFKEHVIPCAIQLGLPRLTTS